jgi:hypothetical protein
MQFVASSQESLTELRRKRLGILLSFCPFLILPQQIGVDVRAMSKVMRYRAVHFLKPQNLEILTDCFRGVASMECMDDRIQGNSRPGNVKVALDLFDVLRRHTSLILLIYEV